MARHGDRPLGLRTAPDIVTGAVTNPRAAVGDQMQLELAQRRNDDGVSRPASARYPLYVELHVIYEPDEDGWVRASIEELPGVITCARTLDEARLLVRDALTEWLEALTSDERATISSDATRETLTLSVA